MPKAGFEPAITASERSKTVRSATATGQGQFYLTLNEVIKLLFMNQT
jgi:hypothetical protein